MVGTLAKHKWMAAAIVGVVVLVGGVVVVARSHTSHRAPAAAAAAANSTTSSSSTTWTTTSSTTTTAPPAPSGPPRWSVTTTDRTGTTNSTDWTVASFHVTENGERTSPARAIERALDDDADAVLADNLASDTPPDQLTIGGPELTTFGDHYLSVTFDAVWNMLDAAHPSTTRTALTFEQSTGAAVDPLSLFTSRDAGLQFLSDWSRPRLLALEGIDPNTDAISAQNVADGTAPTEHNYRTLTLRPDGLMITFGQYQVGPYALGFVGNVVPWSELGSLLRPDAIDPGATRPARYTTGDFFTVPDGFDPPLPAELGRATDPMSTQIAVGDTFFVWLFVTLPDVAEVAILHNDAAAAGWHLDVQGSWPLPCGSVPREVLEPQGIDC